MNDDLERFDLMMDAYAELKTELETAHHAEPIPVQPALDQVLADFGPMPEEALFLGVASDELPVLLNLHDPLPGPLLILGDPGTGKTAFLKTIARAAGKMHPPDKLQFGALTNHPEEWNGFDEIPNNVGVFSIHHRSAEDFILSLASWAHGNKTSKQSVLLLLDDLDAITNLEMEAVHNLRWLLLRGPSRRVWPIITLSSQFFVNMESWLGAFRTRIFGKIRNADHIRRLDAEGAELGKLERGSEFVMREGKQWLHFWIPALNE